MDIYHDKSCNCDDFFETLRTFFCLKIGGLERHNRHIREFYLIVINLAKRQSGKIFWKNTSNPNMRGSSTGVTSVTTNHRFSNNLRLFTKLCHFVPFFQKNPFDKVGYYLRNENDKFLFF